MTHVLPCTCKNTLKWSWAINIGFSSTNDRSQTKESRTKKTYCFSFSKGAEYGESWPTFALVATNNSELESIFASHRLTTVRKTKKAELRRPIAFHFQKGWNVEKSDPLFCASCDQKDQTVFSVGALKSIKRRWWRWRKGGGSGASARRHELRPATWLMWRTSLVSEISPCTSLVAAVAATANYNNNLCALRTRVFIHPWLAGWCGCAAGRKISSNSNSWENLSCAVKAYFHEHSKNVPQAMRRRLTTGTL